MVISRQLAHRLLNNLQLIVSTVELNQPQKAIQYARESAQLINAHVESATDEKARRERDAS